MSLLCFNSFSLHSPLPSSSSSSILTIATTPFSRTHFYPIVGLPTKCLRKDQISTTFVVKRRESAVIVGAVGEGVDGTSLPEEGGGSVSAVPAAANEVVSVDKLPLESKLKEREEQRLRMKLAKKIRLRRKRLVRKRKLRKKGRWPPSKMKKLKNV
ncbi:hypothetical protein TanjilG_13014 [Lupinus angustifolius]|uniref:50S ribosomal protein 5, chloroplastic n=1 Tax=Lupinus angustifolius TaxID=3871 RepID=A0A1J7GS22_LUPAN|nr:PREDICTED: 50S ribosomal protein 5, chloroplastic-like isoform X1 [Lupinus angustifolius]XP_019458386.1 PREDICTED: 50S ribosomal protein 5, chloroplastic-like isoform X2 [Lupinus angustifolius]XP_019458387.1 PREDICTED: 50S ribosomal protein 5, chloroplastic-like isoform X3 [Lupinus angustifolius]OIW03220.1 hypothetical protein TanjilG_13014 [Lupinus angustifolius]